MRTGQTGLLGGTLDQTGLRPVAVEKKGEGGRQRVCETGGRLGSGGPWRIQEGDQGKVRETCMEGIRWGMVCSLEMGEGTC